MSDSIILPPELKNVGELLLGVKKFVVPKYQRNFAWGEDEIEELWEDILGGIDSNTEYFLGTIVLDISKQDRQEIIDGQQRVACISMIFSAIRNALLTRDSQTANQLFLETLGGREHIKGSKPKPKLELNKCNKETYIKFIVESKDLQVVQNAIKNKGLHESNRLLLKAYKFFLERINTAVSEYGIRYEKFSKTLIEYLFYSVKVITIPVNSHEAANLYFESLNARGKELAISDLVKNRLYMEAKDEVDRAQNIWEQMEVELTRLSIPEFLRHYWIAKKTESNSLLVRGKKIYRAINNEFKIKKTDPIILLEDIKISAHDYVKISDYSLWENDPAYDSSFQNTIEDMKDFRVSQCNPLLLNVVQLFTSAKEISKVFRSVANFAFRYYIIGNQSPGNLERETSKIAYEVRVGNYKNSDDIANSLRAINPDSTFRSNFEIAVMPKNRKKLARDILMKINDYIATQSDPTGSLHVMNKDPKSVTLEHIFPQSCPSDWFAYFRKDEKPADYVYRIGNMTLITKSANIDIGNKSFKDKKQVFSNFKLPINEYINSAVRWGNIEIEQRQKQLAKYALEVWKI